MLCLFQLGHGLGGHYGPRVIWARTPEACRLCDDAVVYSFFVLGLLQVCCYIFGLLLARMWRLHFVSVLWSVPACWQLDHKRACGCGAGTSPKGARLPAVESMIQRCNDTPFQGLPVIWCCQSLETLRRTCESLRLCPPLISWRNAAVDTAGERSDFRLTATSLGCRSLVQPAP